ncbi:LysM peptidoglycan-binding domain-containing protein [Pseudobacillus badius]|uniref:LysM peptidoglycan-binding domain-containing protein n=1 Tax=Bacillus badius TaxID=1455 RepID=UPI0007B3EFB5|nr:LysM peptidoglycan-binding domain-containing protein [Bacillus badius]KZR58975.1 hypothetical protein A3781_00255 [Bacillus badius]
MAKLNGLHLHVEKESLMNDVNVPQHPVEKGIKLSDHVERLPQSLSLTGKILRDSGSKVNSVISDITKLQKDGKPITYSGRKVYHNMVVKNFSYDADANIANGFNFTIVLQEIRIANKSYTTGSKSAKPESKSGLKQTEGKNTGKQYHTIKKGDTYWALGIKYGTPWQTLYEWNKTDPRKLQIGQKIRVK